MIGEPPEFYAAIRREKTRKMLELLPDEVCRVLCYGFGLGNTPAKGVREMLMEWNEQT